MTRSDLLSFVLDERTRRRPADKDVAASAGRVPGWKEHARKYALRLLAFSHPRAGERVAQCGRADDLEPGAVEVAEARLRDDRAREAEALRLLQPCRDALHAAQLAAEPELADEYRARIGRLVATRRRERHRDREIRRGFADAQAADEVDVDVVLAEPDARALGEDREEHREPLRVGAVHRAPRQAERRRRHESLHFHEQWSRAFDRGDDDAAGHSFTTLLEEDL